MVRQRKVDVIHQLHAEVLNGIIDHRLRQFKINHICLGRKADDISGNLFVLQDKNLFNLTLPKLIPDGFVVTDSLSHENGLLARVIQGKHQRIVQHLDYTHVITSSPRSS